MLELRIHGRGGQGVVTMAELLAKAAVKSGLEAQTLPFFGVERRGAVVKACVRLDEAPIKIRSMSYHPQAIALTHANLLSYAQMDGIEDDTIFIVNATEPLAIKQPQWLIDAETVATTNKLVFSGEPFINVPMLGAIAKVLNLPLEVVEAAIRDHWKGSKADLNLMAARQAYEQVEKVEYQQAKITEEGDCQ
jgi:2-oxoacid:acceptor oxidoreductase gamma subunit (pyruvate/2-ketoisovalerate family)